MNFEQLQDITEIEHKLKVIAHYDRCEIVNDKMVFIFYPPSTRTLCDGEIIQIHKAIRVSKYITLMNSMNPRKIALKVIQEYLDKVM